METLFKNEPLFRMIITKNNIKMITSYNHKLNQTLFL